MELPPTHPVKSNVFYFFWIVVAHLWNIVCTIILVVLFSLKHYYFPMTKAAADFCMVSPFLWFVVNLIKLQVGRFGNRSEHIPMMICALVLGICCILLEVYFLIWQPYLWSWEAPFHYVSICVDAIFVTFSLVLLIIFAIK